MLGGRVKSALFIDYENVPDLCPADRIANWISWLEQGAFDRSARKRRLIEKNIYWGPKDQRHEEAFKRHGFNIILCDKFHALKNGADIRIALDVMESIFTKPTIEEFIVFAKDTDYTPVLQRIQVKEKKSAILADEQQERVFSVFDERADIVIPVRIFREAPNYAGPGNIWERAKNGIAPLLGRIRHPFQRNVEGQALTAPIAKTEEDPSLLAKTAPPAISRQARAGVYPSKGAMAAAVRAVVRVTQLKPNEYTANREIELELSKRVREFSKRGPASYLGFGSLGALLHAIAAETDGRIEVTNGDHGGVRVRYIPREEE